MLVATRREKNEPIRTYSKKQCLEILCCKTDAFLAHIHAGRLKAFKAGKSWAVLEKDLLAFIESRRLGA